VSVNPSRRSLASRVAFAFGISAFGYAVAVVSDSIFGSGVDPVGALFVAAPFGLVSLLVAATEISLVAVALCVAVLGFLVGYGYYWDASHDSSTASIALLGAWTPGIPCVLAVFGADMLVRRVRRQAREM